MLRVVAITGTTIGLLMHTMDPMVENVMRRYKSRIVVFFLYLLLLVFLIILPTTSIAGFLHLIEGGGYNPTISRLITETTNARMQPVPLEAIGSKIFVFLFRIYNLLLVCYSVVAMGELVEEYYTRIVAYTENLQAPQRYDTGRVIRAPRGRGRKASILQPFLFCIFFGPALCIIVALPFMGLYMGTEGTKLWESFRFALGSLILTYFDNDVVMTDNKSQIVSFFYSFFILPVLGTIIAVGAAGLRPFWQMYCLKVNSWNIEDNARRAESTEGKFQAYWTFCVIWLPAFFVVMAGITGSWVANNEGWSNNEGFLFIIQNLLPSPCHLVGEQIQPATEDGSMVLQFIARVTGLAAIGALAAFSGEALEGIYDTYFDELFGSEITGSSARRQQRNPYNADDYPTSDDSEDDTDDDTSEASSDESSEEESSSSEDPELGGE